ncbi:twin-arginine translocase TatA/TatE family subunit [Roseimarinus sediminis]|jgi:sec-independent protein translocase protein TatA|uniref:twin-arginine translocase TatA/TatE family subunit n=1 Tax=Roseimarinus sediminis TaxID=1610899 RepID=UPI003D1AD9D2
MTLNVIAGWFGGQEVIIILIIVLIFFGGRKIPELMKGLGKGMKEFKNATSEDDDKPEANKGEKENR